ncbi:hypothetical protein KQ313_10060 [Synechococcus sp. CS-1325]|uniref:hypothetical protein n=1 Tax=unclassified Synechococcus TaxID=2626047 RepID=UPI000DB7C9F3|nr:MULTISPECIES: hypothetical protein [unclassified Synechococcus]MCT0200022.1 hypothetical protein [Synechococcus sp. CS-1325]MCT0212021.1 hypothetical protein [Synechococcus sp. CS-1326]MCT0232431.1 hypothetical protein [Synechococcus sp. CS-1327]PZU99053.1 MAG: hypothetical protein DCF24_09875 [Cyanobium sp.]
MPEEACQCPDCQRFYREHDRLIREHATLRQQQELNWAALQSFRTLAGRVLEELQKEHGEEEADSSTPRTTHESSAQAPGGGVSATAPGAGADAGEADSMQQAIGDLENINAHLFSIEALMERIFDVRVPEEVEKKFREVAGELAPDPLNADRLRLNRLLHQTPDLPDRG